MSEEANPLTPEECVDAGSPKGWHGEISTLESGQGHKHRVCPGDFIICGVEGEMYPCKPGIFAQTYEAADADCGRRKDG